LTARRGQALRWFRRRAHRRPDPHLEPRRAGRGDRLDRPQHPLRAACSNADARLGIVRGEERRSSRRMMRCEQSRSTVWA